MEEERKLGMTSWAKGIVARGVAHANSEDSFLSVVELPLRLAGAICVMAVADFAVFVFEGGGGVLSSCCCTKREICSSWWLLVCGVGAAAAASGGSRAAVAAALLLLLTWSYCPARSTGGSGGCAD